MHVTLGKLFGTPSPSIIDAGRADAFMAAHNLPTLSDLPDPKAVVGIEVEVENILSINPNLTLGFWEIDEDSSLRNNGREFISKPISSQFVRPALVHLFECLNKDIDFSKRTSVHIHLNARTFTVENLVAFLLTYVVVENLLFKYADLSRRSNIYCVPIQETSLLDTPVEDWQVKIRHITDIWHKYTALNLLPLTSLGTIEFRHMPGTADVSKLMVWIAMIQKLKLYAFKAEYKDILARISELNTNSQYRAFIMDVFGDYYHYLDLTNLQFDMEKGVTLVKSCALNNTFHQEMLLAVNYDSPLYARMKKEFEKVNGNSPRQPQKPRKVQINPTAFVTDNWLNEIHTQPVDIENNN